MRQHLPEKCPQPLALRAIEEIVGIGASRTAIEIDVDKLVAIRLEQAEVRGRDRSQHDRPSNRRENANGSVSYHLIKKQA